MSNIFDLSCVEDLPENLVSELVTIRRDKFGDRLVDLISLSKDGLNIDQLMCGYYRIYGAYEGRSKVVAKLYNMQKLNNSPIKKVKGKKCIYKITKGQNK